MDHACDSTFMVRSGLVRSHTLHIHDKMYSLKHSHQSEASTSLIDL